MGHLPKDCIALYRKFNPSERNYPQTKQVHFQDQDNFRPSNHISYSIPQRYFYPETVFVTTRVGKARMNVKESESQNDTQSENEYPEFLRQKLLETEPEESSKKWI